MTSDLQKPIIYAILFLRNPFHTIMALTTPPDTCPVPDLPHSVPAIAKSGVDIIQNPPIVRIGDVQESVEDKRAIGQFLANLQARCQNIDMTKTFGKVSIFHVPIEYQEKV